jgi:hypothetical protein
LDEKKVELEQVRLWETNLAKSEKMSDHEKLDFLWLGLRNMGVRRNSGVQSAEVDQIYSKLQGVMLSIPGHAQHFADWLEAERAKSLDPSYGGDYQRYRFRYLNEVLQNLPSPETIQVLGHYLGDDRDTPPPEIPGQDWQSPPANSFIATRALMNIGLNDSPVPIHVKPWEQRALDLQRAWWEEVKSGKRSFSFHGQNVEYRFSPEGTVLKTPRDGSKDPEPLSDNSRSTRQPKPVCSSPVFRTIAGGLIFVCIAAGWWLRARYRRLHSRSV